MKKTIYEMLVDGQKVESLEELAALLGVDEITAEQVTGDGEYADLVSVKEVEVEEVDKSTTYSALENEDVTVSPEEVSSSLPKFENIDELKEFIKDLDTPTLEYIVRGLGLEFTPTYHASIHRMRIAMALQKHLFPELFKPKESKKKAKYGDLSTSDLEELAKEHKISWTKTNNEPIDRMKLIMLLKQSGHLPG